MTFLFLVVFMNQNSKRGDILCSKTHKTLNGADITTEIASFLP